MGRHFYFLMSFQSVFRGLRQGLAKENTAAKRDDFLSATQPLKGAALHNQPGKAIFTARNEKADLGFSVLKSAFRSLSSFMFFRYVSAIRGTAVMLRRTTCQVFHDRADLPRYLSFRRDSAV